MSRFSNLFVLFLFFGPVWVFAQSHYVNPSGVYEFDLSKNYKTQKSANAANEFVFVNMRDSTSIVVNVNVELMNEAGVKSFKAETNAQVESGFFSIVQNPKLQRRGDVERYKNQSIYFHVTHDTKVEAENNYMMTYLFYHKGRCVTFIVRTKAYRLPLVMDDIDALVNSVNLI